MDPLSEQTRRDLALAMQDQTQVLAFNATEYMRIKNVKIASIADKKINFLLRFGPGFR
jgi:hypothetical protein